SIHDNVFRRGGQSLLAVRMLALVWKGFNRSISLPGLFQNPTIAQMAELIMTVEEEPASAILVPIEPVGSEIPFFFVHPVGGSVVCYADIARALGPEYPVYGLQSPSPDAGYEITSIEQMAELYIQEIRRVQPEGPYLLGGW